jgi:hypothetical protein
MLSHFLQGFENSKGSKLICSSLRKQNQNSNKNKALVNHNHVKTYNYNERQCVTIQNNIRLNVFHYVQN